MKTISPFLFSLFSIGCGGGGGAFNPGMGYYPIPAQDYRTHYETYVPQPVSVPDINISGIGPQGSETNPFYVAPAVMPRFHTP